MEENDSTRKHEKSLEQLDTLILKFYNHIDAHIEDFVKVGDLLKMIELKEKLLPDNSNQKEFWQMMEQIRKQKLPGSEKPTPVTVVPKRSNAT